MEKKEEIPNNNQEEKVDLKTVIETQVKRLKNKDFNIYFFTMDTKGNATAGIYNIYKQVKTLIELGFNAKILHEKNEYTSVKG